MTYSTGLYKDIQAELKLFNEHCVSQGLVNSLWLMSLIWAQKGKNIE